MLTGENLRELRISQGFSLEDLADRSRIPRTQLAEIEEGRRKMTANALARLAQVLDIPQEILNPTAWQDVASSGMGQKIRAMRKERGWNLAELGAAAGLSVTYLSDIEREAIVPSLSAVRSLAAAFGVPISLFINNARKSSLVAEKLKRARIYRNLSQKDLAARAGISPGLIGQLETGRVQASLQTIQKIADALGVSVCSLILEQEEVEAIVGALSPELRDLLFKPEVQMILGATCTMPPEKIKLVLNFIAMLNDPRI